MKAVVKKRLGYDQMALLEVPEPEVVGDFVKIKVAYTGICGSDIHTFKGSYNKARTPVTLGHEFSGQVMAVGPAVTAFKVGNRVTSETTFTTCGDCGYCLTKDYNLCDRRQGLGTQVDGSMADYVLSREESCHLLPSGVSYQAGALVEPLACAVHGVLEKTTVTKNQQVLVIGPGPIGLLVAQVAHSQGAKVILTGVTGDRHRLALAKELGIRVIDVLKEDVSELVMQVTACLGVDRVFDCSGAISAVNQALPLLRKQGTIVQIGLFKEALNPMDQATILQRELQYIGSRSQKPSSWILALDLLASGKLQVEAIISKVYPLDKWRQAFQVVEKGQEVKVLLESNLAWKKEG